MKIRIDSRSNVNVRVVAPRRLQTLEVAHVWRRQGDGLHMRLGEARQLAARAGEAVPVLARRTGEYCDEYDATRKREDERDGRRGEGRPEEEGSRLRLHVENKRLRYDIHTTF